MIFRQNGGIWAIWWNLDLMVKFGLSGEISQNCEMWSALLNFAKIINYKGIVLTRLYWKKWFIERKALLYNRSKLSWIVQVVWIVCIVWFSALSALSVLSVLSVLSTSSALSCYWNFDEIEKFGQNCKIWSKLQNLVKITKFGQHCRIWSKLPNLVKIAKWNFFKISKFGLNCEI